MKNKIFTKFTLIILIISQSIIFPCNLHNTFNSFNSQSLQRKCLAPSSSFSKTSYVMQPVKTFSLKAPYIKKIIFSALLLCFLVTPFANSFAHTATSPEPSAQEQTLDQIREQIQSQYKLDQRIQNSYKTELQFNQEFEKFQHKFQNKYSHIEGNYYLKNNRYDEFRYDHPFISDEANKRIKEVDAFLTSFYDKLDLKSAELDPYMTKKIHLIKTKNADPVLIKMLIIDLLSIKKNQPEIYNSLVEKNTSILYTALDMHGNATGDSFYGMTVQKRSFMTIAKASVSVKSWTFRQSTMIHEGRHILDLVFSKLSAIIDIHKGLFDIFKQLPSIETPAFKVADNFILRMTKIKADSSFYAKNISTYSSFVQGIDSYYITKARYTLDALFLIVFEILIAFGLGWVAKKTLQKRSQKQTRQINKTTKQTIFSNKSRQNKIHIAKQYNNISSIILAISGILKNFITKPNNNTNQYRSQPKSSIIKTILQTPLVLINMFSSITSNLKKAKKSKKNDAIIFIQTSDKKMTPLTFKNWDHFISFLNEVSKTEKHNKFKYHGRSIQTSFEKESGINFPDNKLDYFMTYKELVEYIQYDNESSRRSWAQNTIFKIAA